DRSKSSLTIDTWLTRTPSTAAHRIRSAPAMSESAYETLRARVGELWDVAKLATLASGDQQTMMPPQGAAVRARQLATVSKLAHDLLVSDDLGRLLDQLAPYGESLDYDSTEASLIRAVRRDREKELRVPAELREEAARAAADERLPALPARARAQRRAAAPLRGLLRRGRAVRRPPRRLRARDEDGGGASRLRPAEGGPRAADRGGRPRRRGRLVPLRPVPAAGAAGARAHRPRPLRLPRGDVAHRPDRAPVRDVARHRRHPADHPLPRGRAERRLRRHARGRARDLRAQRRPGARANAALPRLLARLARVPEPAVREPRRPRPRLVALALAAGPAPVPTARHGARRRLPSRDQPRQAVADPDRGGRGHLQP